MFSHRKEEFINAWVIRPTVNGRVLSKQEEELLAEGANWEHDGGMPILFHIFIITKYSHHFLSGAVHSCDAEKFFQIERWSKEDEVANFNNKQKYAAFASRYIQRSPAGTESKDTKTRDGAISVHIIEKYCFVLESFKDCPSGRDLLYQDYMKNGSKCAFRMNAFYCASFRKLVPELKVIATCAFLRGGISGSKFCFAFYLHLY